MPAGTWAPGGLQRPLFQMGSHSDSSTWAYLLGGPPLDPQHSASCRSCGVSGWGRACSAEPAQTRSCCNHAAEPERPCPPLSPAVPRCPACLPRVQAPGRGLGSFFAHLSSEVRQHGLADSAGPAWSRTWGLGPERPPPPAARALEARTPVFPPLPRSVPRLCSGNTGSGLAWSSAGQQGPAHPRGEGRRQTSLYRLHKGPLHPGDP